MSLFDYMKKTQMWLRETKQDNVNPGHIINYINQGRREIAMRAMCCRALTPISGAITSFTINAGGSGYTAPVVVISTPDFPSGNLPFPNGLQATASASVLGGAINAVNVVSGGSGYFQPQVTITDPTGSGASVTGNIATLSELASGQEVYAFSNINLSPFPGMRAVYMVKSVSILYSNFRYSLVCYSFSTYQAMIRQYANIYQYVPFFCAQFGQGTSGSFYMFPIPSQPYQVELDCFCLPNDLTTDTDVEAIPEPWTDAVPYFAVSLCYQELQNLNFARGYMDMFDRQMGIYGRAARPGRVINPYGRPPLR